jgi:hypothetical protein
MVEHELESIEVDEVTRPLSTSALHAPYAAKQRRAEVLAWYRAQGEGWQTRMNAVLKAYKDASG